MNLPECHEDHRKRMRDRFLKNGVTAFEDHETLEVLLYSVIKRRNTNDLAHNLLDRFGSLAGVLTADQGQLCEMAHIGEVTATYLNLLGKAMIGITSGIFREIPLDNEDRIGMYAVMRIGMMPFGSAVALYLNGKGVCMSEEWLYSGTERMTDKLDDRILRNALDIGAKSIILAHDHRGEVLEVSPEDSVITELLRDAAENAGIKLWHVIVSDDGYIFI